MISLEKIENEIQEREQLDATYANCERLAWLYIVCDHLIQPTEYIVSRGTVPLSPISSSEFMTVCSDKNITNLLSVLDEHMTVIKLLMSKEYNSLITKIKAIE